ncbi:MAG: hypothetical protein ACYDA8_13785 [Deferrisomatales bacterium]
MRSCPSFRVGAVGHRGLSDPGAAARAVGEVLGRIARRAPGPLVVLSSLAEGADRLVAWAGLDRGASLRAVLPLAPGEYEADFATAASRGEFRCLLGRAESVAVADPAADRRAAYEAAGRAVVEGCDALVALWDGAPARGRGGTAEVVAHARALGRPLYWIHAESPCPVDEERTDATPRGHDRPAP